MADVFSAIILNNDYWDGTESWAGEMDEAARDSKYGARRFTSMSLWEADRDGNAQAADTEYANIFGPWVSHDTAEFLFADWTNNPTIIIQTIGPDARSQDGKFGSNSCYVLENDEASFLIDMNESGHDLTFIGVQFYNTSITGVVIIYMDRDGSLVVKKCFFKSTNNAKSIWVSAAAITLVVENSICTGTGEHIKGAVGTGSAVICNCTIEGSAADAIEDDGGTWTVKNCAVFNNLDDFDSVDFIDYCASDDQNGTNSQDLGGDAAGWNAAFTDYANGDYTVKDINSVLYNNGVNLSGVGITDDIKGTARPQAGSWDIGAYKFEAGVPSFIPEQLGFSPFSGIY